MIIFNFYAKIILYNNHIFAITLNLGLSEVPFHVYKHVACLRRHLVQEKKKHFWRNVNAALWAHFVDIVLLKLSFLYDLVCQVFAIFSN